MLSSGLLEIIQPITDMDGPIPTWYPSSQARVFTPVPWHSHPYGYTVPFLREHAVLMSRVELVSAQEGSRPQGRREHPRT